MEGNGEEYYLQGCLPDWLRDLPITEDWFNFDGFDGLISTENDYHTLVEQRGQPNVQSVNENEEERELARTEVCLSKIPPGYRFLPEDEELIKDYLMAKVNKKPLPMNKIRSVAFYRYPPDVLIEKYYGDNKGQREKEWYFFTIRERKRGKGTRASRLTPHGFWKATGSDKVITLNGKVIGFRKSLDFYDGIDQPSAKRSQWKMHEYRLNKSNPPPSPSSSNDIADPNKLDELVLCKVYKWKTKKGNDCREGGSKRSNNDYQEAAEVEVVGSYRKGVQNSTATSNNVGAGAEWLLNGHSDPEVGIGSSREMAHYCQGQHAEGRRWDLPSVYNRR